MKYLGYTMIALSIAGIITLRIKGLHMTEGELFVEFWPYWLCVICVISIGGVLTMLPEQPSNP